MAGQFLAMERWEPDFVPSQKPIQKTMVWMMLSALPIEYWISHMILAIEAKAGKLLAVDDFTEILRKTGYAQIRVEIDAVRPLKLGVFIKGGFPSG